MWALNNRTPFAAGRTWSRDLNGWHQWIVAVKATYEFTEQGEIKLAEEQTEPVLAPEYFGEPGESSLKYDAELVPTKPVTDILLNGTAHAPEGKPSVEFAVGLGINGRRKILRVLGERRWEKTVMGLKPSSPRPVLQVPLCYENAFGGWDKRDPDPKRQKWDPRNPVGKGIYKQDSDKQDQPLHQIEHLEGEPHSAGPAGFGAIDRFWSPRRELNGTYDKAWQQQRQPLLPLDWQPRSLQSAPFDQQTAKPLHGGETIELLNLTPGGRVSFQLPKVFLGFTTAIDGRKEDHRAQLSSVLIEPDLFRFQMVWNTVLLCRNEADYLDYTIIRQKRYEQ